MFDLYAFIADLSLENIKRYMLKEQISSFLNGGGIGYNDHIGQARSSVVERRYYMAEADGSIPLRAYQPFGQILALLGNSVLRCRMKWRILAATCLWFA